jgi:hypothetical protein
MLLGQSVANETLTRLVWSLWSLSAKMKSFESKQSYFGCMSRVVLKGRFVVVSHQSKARTGSAGHFGWSQLPFVLFVFGLFFVWAV